MTEIFGRKGKLDESYRISDNVIKDLPACEQEKGKVFHGRDARNSRGGSSEFSFQTSIGKNSRDDSFPAKTNHSPLALRSNETNRNEGRYVGKNDEGFSTRRWNSNCFDLLSTRVGIDRGWRVIFKGHIVRPLCTGYTRLATIADIIPFDRKSIRFDNYGKPRYRPLWIVFFHRGLDTETTKWSLFVSPFAWKTYPILGNIYKYFVRYNFDETTSLRPTVFSVKIFPGKFDSMRNDCVENHWYSFQNAIRGVSCSNLTNNEFVRLTDRSKLSRTILGFESFVNKRYLDY